MHSKLTNNLNAEQIVDLKEVAQRYKELDEETLFSYLWKMTYDPKYALQKIGLNDEVFLELYKKVRNYIFEEYGKPEILGDPDTYHEDLFKALGQDKFAYCFIGRKIQDAIFSYSEEELKRIASLLNSDLLNNQFGGLRALGLTLSEAQFFENYEKSFSLIGEIFNQNLQKEYNNHVNRKVSGNYYGEEKKEEKNECDNKDKDLIEMFSKCVENKEELLKFFQNLTMMDMEHNITFKEFLEDYDFFKEYIDMYETIKEKGVNIDWLNENLDSIKKLLS